MTRKRFLSLFVFLCTLITSSIFISASQEIDFSDSVYTLIPDSLPLIIPSDENQYRFDQESGRWEVKYGDLAGWGDVGPYFNLTDILNSYDLATSEDVQTAISTALEDYSLTPQQISDSVLSGLIKYFSPNADKSPLPMIFSYPVFGNSGNSSQTFNNIFDFLGQMLRIQSFGSVLNAGNNYLRADGNSASSNTNTSLPYILSNGFMGLSSNLSLLSGSVPSSVLSSLNSYFGNSFPFTLNLIRNGYAGNSSITFSSLGSALTEILRFQSSNVLAAGNSYLHTNGTISDDDTNISLPYLIARGFNGLSTNVSSQTQSINSTNSSLFSQYFRGAATILDSDGTAVNDIFTIEGINARGFIGLANRIFGTSTVQMNRHLLGSSEWNTPFVASSLKDVLATYLLDLDSALYIAPGNNILYNDGSLSSTASVTPLSDIVRRGFLGVGNTLNGYNVEGYSYSWIDYSDPSKVKVITETNILEAIVGLHGDVQNMLAEYMYSHGTDLDIKERQNMQQQADAFVDDFTSSSGSGTPSVDNISDTAGVSGGIKNTFSGSATPSDVFNQLGNSDNYSFFSSQVQNELNPFVNYRSYSLDPSDQIEDMVSPKLESILGGVGSSW